MDDRQEEKLLMEVRERVNDILAATQLLTPLVRDQGGHEERGYLAAVNKGLYRLLRTVQHMEASGEEMDFCPEPLDLAGLCRDVARQVEPMAERLGVEFEWTLEPEGVLSVADDQLLEMAALNLLTNALEAAGKGGRVSLSSTVSGGRWKLTVTDNGPGIQRPDPDASPFLKQPGGLGLGLAAVRRAAGLHGGALVLLENGTESGVRAVLSLPIRKPDRKERLYAPHPKKDRRGGFSPLLVELSPILPAECYLPEDVE